MMQLNIKEVLTEFVERAEEGNSKRKEQEVHNYKVQDTRRGGRGGSERLNSKIFTYFVCHIL